MLVFQLKIHKTKDLSLTSLFMDEQLRWKICDEKGKSFFYWIESFEQSKHNNSCPWKRAEKNSEGSNVVKRNLRFSFDKLETNNVKQVF